MTQRIYVGNLRFRSTEEDLGKLFGAYGEVTSVKIVVDRETGKSGGIVEMPTGGGAAIVALNGHSFDGRQLIVRPARRRTDTDGWD